MASARFKGLGLIALAAALVGCAIPKADLRPHAEFLQKARVEDRPLRTPSRSVSSFSDAQSCMDRLLSDANLGPVNIASKFLGDATGKLGVSVKDMAITSLLRMSRISNTFRVVDYEVEAFKQDTVQTLTSVLLPTGQMEIRRPQIYLSGGISFNDGNVLSKRRNVGLSAKSTLDGTPSKEGDLGYSDDINVGILGLDLHLGDFLTRSLLPGLESSNEVLVATTGTGVDLGARIRKLGIQFELSSNIGQGQGAAIRALVDLAMIELIGRWSRLPYWLCLQIDASSAEMQRELWHLYEATSEDERTKLAKRALRQMGYYDGDVNELAGAAFRRVLARWQADNNLIPQGGVSFETYEKLMSRFLERDDNGRLVRVGWGNAEPTLGEKVEPNPPAVVITLNKRIASYLTGEQVGLRILPSRSGFMRCYYQDSTGVIAQIFPNPQQPISMVEAGRAILIPDTNQSSQLFTIEAKIPGAQGGLCVLSTDDLVRSLPSALAGIGLTPIAGLTSLQSIVEEFGKAKGAAQVGAAAVSWQVQARTPPAAPAAVTN